MRLFEAIVDANHRAVAFQSLRPGELVFGGVEELPLKTGASLVK
jgi:hypothetical protein